ENYSKGKNVEEPMSKDNIPIPDLPSNFIWMQVGAGSKMRNLLGYAMKAFKNEKAIVWSGSGAAISKTISCAEIMKRNNRQIHQITKICYRKVEEYWEPQLEDLDRLVVEREVPTIHILLSKDSLNTAELGYQAPGSFDAFWKSKEGTSDKRKRSGNSKRNTKSNLSPEEFAALGLRTSQKHSSSKPKQNTERTVYVDVPESSKENAEVTNS
ncbi:hypothetical protein L9F63_003042, partial [Diploptera punctata]